jgi:hypothetical protein
VDGATLTRYRLPDGSAGYVQRIDLRVMRIDQVIGARDTGRPATPGSYYPGGDSPRFRRIPVGDMQRECQNRYGAKTFSAVNFSFFEDYDPTTALSFPVKAGGALVSAGSSPYGPVPAPKHSYYRGITLRVLSWDGQGARIEPYQPATGTPLDRPDIRDAVVTYAYPDHPSYVLDADPANRYQVLGLSGGRYLLIATVEHATLDAAAKLLRDKGVSGDILTFDGGISTFLWSAGRGVLVPVRNNDGALPHYLCVHSGQ